MTYRIKFYFSQKVLKGIIHRQIKKKASFYEETITGCLSGSSLTGAEGHLIFSHHLLLGCPVTSSLLFAVLISALLGFSSMPHSMCGISLWLCISSHWRGHFHSFYCHYWYIILNLFFFNFFSGQDSCAAISSLSTNTDLWITLCAFKHYCLTVVSTYSSSSC